MTPDIAKVSNDVTVFILNGRKIVSMKRNLSACQALLLYQPMTLVICLNAYKNEKKKIYKIKKFYWLTNL